MPKWNKNYLYCIHERTLNRLVRKNIYQCKWVKEYINEL